MGPSFLPNSNHLRRPIFFGTAVCPRSNITVPLSICSPQFSKMSKVIVGTLAGATLAFFLLPTKVLYYLTDPTDVEFMLVKQFDSFVKGHQFWEVLEPLLGKGIFSADGKSW